MGESRVKSAKLYTCGHVHSSPLRRSVVSVHNLSRAREECVNHVQCANGLGCTWAAVHNLRLLVYRGHRVPLHSYDVEDPGKNE